MHTEKDTGAKQTTNPHRIIFQDSLDAKWALFFQQLGWKWKYNRDSAFRFTLQFEKDNKNKLDLQVIVAQTDDYAKLIGLHQVLIEEETNLPCLLLGNRLLYYDDVKDEPNIKNRQLSYNKGRIIGLISYKINGEITNSLAVFYKNKQSYSLGWEYYNCCWIVDLIQSINDDGKTYDLLCKPNAYFLLNRIDITDDIDKLWEFVESYLGRNLVELGYFKKKDDSSPSTKDVTPKRKEPIPAAVRNSVWIDYHEDSRVGICFCCKRTKIALDNFECGHVISEKNGGQATIGNLRPICSTCNKSMGTKNMNEFIEKHEL